MVLLTTSVEQLERALGRICQPYLISGRPGDYRLDEIEPGRIPPAPSAEAVGYLPAVRPDAMGDASFREEHGLRYSYYSGAMANGIGSAEIVEAMAGAGMLGIFGAAGLPLAKVEAAIDRLQRSLGDRGPHGFNLIHSPNEPALESAVVDLYLRRGVRMVEASAYLDLTLPVVRYRVKGIHRDEAGRVVAPNRVIGKVSRVEVATKFLSPPPERFLRELVAAGEITEEQAGLAARIPMAGDITAEADSGGHTDNQPAIVLLPTILALRDRIQAPFGFDRPTRIGAAGGISTPWSAAGAFAMGADYIGVGSVNQSCVESGSSDTVRKMLAQAQQADIAMAPAADMFEAGIKVQVLKRGTMFAMRGGKLFELYRAHESIDQIPPADRAMLEKTIFRAPLETIWDETVAYFRDRDPAQVERGMRDPKHKMALIFRWYLGRSSHWANSGEPSRAVDYQVWCGPAMAAFNEWARGSCLEAPEARRVSEVAMNILYHAAVLARARIVASQGFPIPSGIPRLVPLPQAEIDRRIVP
ncbi:PfaD family polyunsaturated fatty acid/polyketide biosynthesis protein [Tundrisphaera sp. TA3]|uniref:PfaD family polyunsaturated fatty acid/polyketide biosynthesis protein n=1 Tax=Tundrisphaera sp. TA3 TaxID=3435775 RepID=UPI003EBAD1D6